MLIESKTLINMNLIEHIHEKDLINVFVKNLRECLHEEENTKNSCDWIWRFNVYYIDFFMCCWGLHNYMSSKRVVIFHM